MRILEFVADPLRRGKHTAATTSTIVERARSTADTASASRAWSEVAQRVHGVAVDADLEVKVAPGGLAGAADVADDLALRHDLTGRHRERRLVTVERGETTTVVDDGGVAVSVVRRGATTPSRLPAAWIGVPHEAPKSMPAWSAC